MNILPFLYLDSIPFFFRAIQIIAADKIYKVSFWGYEVEITNILKEQKSEQAWHHTALKIVNERYAYIDSIYKPKIEAILQTLILKSYKIYYSFQVRPP